ncbi:MAG: hypothetical protein HY293_11100 [Planctomycetes bacterium]|nr:hypothetical protein [Planctomycetota bacterium]
MKQVEFSKKPLKVAEGLFVLSFLPSLFMGMFMFVKGFEIKPEPWHRWTFGVSVTVLAISGLMMMIRRLRKDRYPDLLAGYRGVPLECAGVQLIPGCFPTTVAPDGFIRMGLFFQNRFEAASRVTFRLRSPFGGAAVECTIEVRPGETGFCWKDFQLPALPPAGAAMKMEAEGVRGKGREVRFREGKVVRTEISKGLEAVALALSHHAVHAGGAEEDVIAVRTDPELKPTRPAGDPEGRFTIWEPGAPLDEAGARMSRAFALLS